MSNQKREIEYSRAVPHEIEGLYPSFATAVTILRIAKDELVVENEQQVQDLNIFYTTLNTVELSVMEGIRSGRLHNNNSNSGQNDPFIVVVEGLDGTGKTSLVRGIADSVPSGSTWSTPTTSLKSVREIFDRRGGSVARAFYMTSNYILYYEIMNQFNSNSNKQQHPVFVVDRWYCSTCAYSIGWKNTTGTPEESVDILPESLFIWPVDLIKPQLMLLLKVDDKTRKERVRNRGNDDTVARHNPWDGRLDADVNLGRRIFHAMCRVTGPNEIITLDANQTKEQVLHQALSIVQQRVQRHYQPLDYFSCQPLDFFCYISSQMNLCDGTTCLRMKHQPWAIQLALNNNNYNHAPSLRSVGIHSVTSSDILFFTRGYHPGGGIGPCDSDGSVSVLWFGGSYPNEQQWRGEGFLFRVTPAVCELLDKFPPDSLLAQFTACHEEEQDRKDEVAFAGKSFDRSASYQERVKAIRSKIKANGRKSFENEASAFLFVPHRMEVLMGGPGSPNGPHRYEWIRSIVDGNQDNGWTTAREILPFRCSPQAGTENDLSIQRQHVRKHITLVLTGTHCAGKATLGKLLAEYLGWSYDAELGDILRDKDNLIVGGHRIGDGTSRESSNSQQWDDHIHEAECTRDDVSTKNNRVVETWHVGNFAWARIRNNARAGTDACQSETLSALLDKAKDAIQKHHEKSVILFVHLQVSLDATLRRRRNYSENPERLPMLNEAVECEELRIALDEKIIELLHDEFSNIPLLIVDNSVDGDTAIKDTARSIINFVHQNYWRCC